MTQTTRSHGASSEPISPYRHKIGQSNDAGSECKIYWLEKYFDDEPSTPAGYTEIDGLIDEIGVDPVLHEALVTARVSLAEAITENCGQTLRHLRLRKGLSQSDLAQRIGTSQPHIVRIERGNGNLTIDTCRRLAHALEIDLNTLDAALRSQLRSAQ